MRGADAMQESLFTVAKLDDFVPDCHGIYLNYCGSAAHP